MLKGASESVGRLRGWRAPQMMEDATQRLKGHHMSLRGRLQRHEGASQRARGTR